MKTIERIIKPGTPHFVGDGFRVHNFFPSNPDIGFKRMDPFLLMDYNSPYVFPASDKPRGVGAHPHKGFETVTLAYKGRVAHHDSSGGGGVIGEGDVQWMTAGNGLLHKEYHEEEWSKKGGEFQMVQLWINLPADKKSVAPKYQAIKKSDLTVVELKDNGGTVEIIAGEYRDKKGPASTFTHVNLFNARLKKERKATFEFPSHDNTALVVLDGEISVNGSAAIPQNNFVLMGNDGESFEVKADRDSLVLIVSGTPIHEPIAAQGPFVMNTHQELIQAYDDFNKGKFGYLED